MMGRYDVGTMNDYFTTSSKLTTHGIHSVLFESLYAGNLLIFGHKLITRGLFLKYEENDVNK